MYIKVSGGNQDFPNLSTIIVISYCAWGCNSTSVCVIHWPGLCINGDEASGAEGGAGSHGLMAMAPFS